MSKEQNTQRQQHEHGEFSRFCKYCGVEIEHAESVWCQPAPQTEAVEKLAHDFMEDVLSLIATGNVHEHLGHFRASCEVSLVERLIPLTQHIAELKRDKERLESIVSSGDRIIYRNNNISRGWVCEDALARFTRPAFPTWREAIDHAHPQKEQQ